MVSREVATVRVLLLSRDLRTIEILCQAMRQMTMHVEPCCDSGTAMRKLCHAKYEGVVVDLNEGEVALELLGSLRNLTSHKGAITCAILNFAHERATAFRAGANFVLERPLSPSSAIRMLRAAYPLMLRERRRYFRCPVEVDAKISKESGEEFLAKMLNIGEGGAMITSATPLKVGDELRLRLRLPGRDGIMDAKGDVCWADSTGRVGIQFVSLSKSMSEQLQGWLSERVQALIPAGDLDHQTIESV